MIWLFVFTLQKIMFHNPAVLHAFLDHLTEALIVYAGYQIESGAQVCLTGTTVPMNVCSNAKCKPLLADTFYAHYRAIDYQ